jgi:ribonuclease VapC
MSNADAASPVPRYVLDSQAIMAHLQDEPGSSRVEELLFASLRGELALHMSPVNVTEVFYLLWRRAGQVTADDAVDRLPRLGVAIQEVSLAHCLEAGALKAQYPISLADAFAAALAQSLDATVVTGDPEFKRLEDLVRIEWLPTSSG